MARNITLAADALLKVTTGAIPLSYYPNSSLLDSPPPTTTTTFPTLNSTSSFESRPSLDRSPFHILH
jgi:hypothetical protein